MDGDMGKFPSGILLFGIGLALTSNGGLSGQPEVLFKTGLKLATPEQLQGIPLAYTPYSGAELLPRVDLSKDMPPPGDRAEFSVGWAVAYGLKSYEEKIEQGHPYLAGDRIHANTVFSPSYIYNQCNNGRDAGLLYPDAFNLLSQYGAATWADMPYDGHDFTTQPSAEVKERAKRFRIDFWRKVNTQDTKEIKAHLQRRLPGPHRRQGG